MVQEGNLWKKEIPLPKFPTLEGKLEVDVAIIGGGITGIVSAYLLSKSGYKVAVLEKKSLGGGATEYTTALVTQIIDTNLSDLIKIRGIERARLVVDSHRQAIELMAELAQTSNDNCDFSFCNNHIYANNQTELETLRPEFEAAISLGLPVHWHPDGSELGFKNSGYVEVRDQAKVHPFKLIKQVLAEVIQNNVQLFENSEVIKIEKSGHHQIVNTDLGEIHAKWVIVATYQPFNKPLRLYFQKGFYTSYVYEAKLSSGLIPPGIYEDNQSPYHYFRVDKQAGTDRLIIGGEDHRTIIQVDKEKNFAALADYLNKLLPTGSYEIVKRWTGPILEPGDGLPYIGALHDPRVLYAMAFSGNGTTYSIIAASLFKDIIEGNHNPLIDIYRADRIPDLHSLLVKGLDYSKVLAHGAIRNSFKYRKH
jgi:glycine/D-amino acid oxidase-like deaminating enzyme